MLLRIGRVLVLSLLVLAACDDDSSDEPAPTADPAAEEPAEEEPAAGDAALVAQAEELCRTVDPDLRDECVDEVVAEAGAEAVSILCTNAETGDWYLQDVADGDECQQAGYTAQGRVGGDEIIR